MAQTTNLPPPPPHPSTGDVISNISGKSELSLHNNIEKDRISRSIPNKKATYVRQDPPPHFQYIIFHYQVLFGLCLHSNYGDCPNLAPSNFPLFTRMKDNYAGQDSGKRDINTLFHHWQKWLCQRWLHYV